MNDKEYTPKVGDRLVKKKDTIRVISVDAQRVQYVLEGSPSQVPYILSIGDFIEAMRVEVNKGALLATNKHTEGHPMNREEVVAQLSNIVF